MVSPYISEERILLLSRLCFDLSLFKTPKGREANRNSMGNHSKPILLSTRSCTETVCLGSHHEDLYALCRQLSHVNSGAFKNCKFNSTNLFCTLSLREFIYLFLIICDFLAFIAFIQHAKLYNYHLIFSEIQ